MLDLKVSNRLLQRYFDVPTEAIVFTPLSFHISLSKYEQMSGQYLKLISRLSQYSEQGFLRIYLPNQKRYVKVNNRRLFDQLNLPKY